MYDASPDGDASISIYDNRTFTYYTVEDYQEELNLGVEICSVKKEIEEDIVTEGNLVDVFPWVDMYVYDEIERITTPSGTPPLTPALHEYFYEDGNKDAYLDYLKSCYVTLVNNNISVPGGAMVKVLFKTPNTNYELNFYDGYLQINGRNYSVMSDAVYVSPDETDYAFDFNIVSGELFKAGVKMDNATLDTRLIRFIPKVTDNYIGTPEYELRTSYGSIYIYSNQYLSIQYININNCDYVITKGGYKIDYLLEKSIGNKLTFIEEPHVLSSEVMSKLFFENIEGPDNLKNVVSLKTLNSYTGNSLATVLGMPGDISDQMIKDNYSILILRRSGPIDDDFKNVTLSELFVESGNLYVTISYNALKEGVYNNSVCEYIEYVLVHNDFVNKLRSNFNLYHNSKYIDGEFNILPYHLIDDIKRAYHLDIELDGPIIGVVYEVFINRAFGEYNESVAVKMSDSLSFDMPCETEETVGGFTFVYPTTSTIKVYHDKKLYSLAEALEKGFITQDNLQVIYNLYNK